MTGLLEHIKRWWHEGNGHRDPVVQAEDELRKVMLEHAVASQVTKVTAEAQIERTNGLLRTARQALGAVKRGENGSDD